MTRRSVQTAGPQETESLGGELAAGLREGDVVLVRGELGSGKTTLVRGAARALGVVDPVTSPTFAIGNRYRGRDVTVSHLDLYRLAGLEDEEPDLLADYLGPGRIAFVEWPPDGEGELEGARLRVTLSHGGGDVREIVLDCDEREPGGAAMNVIGIDTATSATAVALRLGDAVARASRRPARRRPPRPRHAPAGDGRGAALRRGHRLVADRPHRRRPRAGHVHRPARGRRDRPRARAVALALQQPRRLERCGALASARRLRASAAARPGAPAAVLAVIDARRGEAFAAAFELAARTRAPASSS